MKINSMGVHEVITRLDKQCDTGNCKKSREGQYSPISVHAQNLVARLRTLGRAELIKPAVDPAQRERFEREQRDRSIMQGAKKLLQKKSREGFRFSEHFATR